MQDTSQLKIEGYADQLSVLPGERIGLHVSTNADTYSIEIDRIGANRKPVWRSDDFSGKQHPVPEDAFSHGCRWPAALQLPVPDDWQSGRYSVTMRGRDRHGHTTSGQAFFIVRSLHPGRDAAIVMHLTTNTYNAYNTWGGGSLYRGRKGPARRVSFERPYAGLPDVDGLFLFSMDSEIQEELDAGIISPQFHEKFQKQVEAFAVPGIALSLSGAITTEKPGLQWRIDDLTGQGPPAYKVKKVGDVINVHDGTPFWENGWRNWEQPFVAWAERAGYPIDFATSGDLEFHPETLKHYRLVLSVGHDEYWSAPMRDNLEAYIAAGGNVAFFSGNNLWWQVRSVDEGRALVCWKDAYRQDPVYATDDHSQLSTNWCHRLIGRPENHLTGVSFAYGGYSRFFEQFPDAPGGYTVHRPDHWMLEGTGLKRGDLLGAKHKVVSYECDGCDLEWRDGIPVPTGIDGTPESFTIVATGPAGVTSTDGSLELAKDALYEQPSDQEHPYPGAAVLGTYNRGGTVVTAGCTHWSHGLRGGDDAVERVTRNILDRLST